MKKEIFIKIVKEWRNEWANDNELNVDDFKLFLKEALGRKYLITNIDIDGLLCATHLQKVSEKFKVAGFTDSVNQLYVPKDKSIGENQMSFLDIYMKRGFCFDNHMINVLEHTFGSVLNLNQMRGRGISNYGKKYPFGTCNIIMSLFDRTGVYDDIDPDRTIGVDGDFEVKLWHLYVRADDALTTTTYKYVDNALEWWKFLFKISGKNGLVWKIFKKLEPIIVKKSDSKNVAEYKMTVSEEIKQHVNSFLAVNYNTDTSKHDGYRKLNDNLYHLYKDMCGWVGVVPNIIDPNELELHGYVRLIVDYRDKYNSDYMQTFSDILDNEHVVSHAFTQSKVLAFDVRKKHVDYFKSNYDIKKVDWPISSPNYNIEYIK